MYRIIVKNILVLLADWANGIFAVLLATYLTGTDIVWWHFLVGIIFSHLLDLDAVPDLWRRGRVGGAASKKDHRDTLHYPIVVLPLAASSIVLVGYWGWMLFFAVLLHFINDLYGTGWGIKLLWPFSHTKFKLLGRRVNQPKYILLENDLWDELPHSERRLRLWVSWSAAEAPQYFRRYGMDNWLEDYYIRGSVVAYIEYTLFLSAIVLAIRVVVF